MEWMSSCSMSAWWASASGVEGAILCLSIRMRTSSDAVKMFELERLGESL